MLWGGIVMLLDQQRDDLLSGARHDTENLARAFEENTAHSLEAADQTLLFLRSIYSADPKGFSFAGWNDSVRNSDGLLLQVGVIGPDGTMLASNLGPMLRKIDLSDRSHYRFQRDSPDDRLFISEPMVGRESGKLSIQLTRKLVAADGSFGGAMQASIDPLVLAKFYGSAEIGRGYVFLAGRDGIVRAGVPGGRIVPGQQIPDAIIRDAVMAGERGTVAFVDHTGAPLILSFRRIPRFNLLIAVALNQHDVLASYLRSRALYIDAGLLLSLLILGIGSLLVRHKQRLLRAASDLLQSRAVLTDTLENLSQGIMMVEADGRVAVINRRAIELLGLPNELVATGPRIHDINEWQIESGEFSGIHGQVRESGHAECWDIQRGSSTYERVRPNGMVLEVRTIQLGDQRSVRTLTDVTDRHRFAERISFLAHNDPLTGLANRTRFQDHLTDMIGQADGRSFAVLFFDLDQFKLVNDTWGHATGDRLLAMVADRLRATVRATDHVARFGGDEFAIAQSEFDSAGEWTDLASRLIETVSEPYIFEGRQLSVGVSIGVATYPKDGIDPEQLLKSADIALYAAKEGGRGTFRCFSPEMDRRIQERVAVERDLREAIERDELAVHYQPICDAASGRPFAYEALARWNHPARGWISPAMFIPLAEETGLVLRLGQAVLRAACRTAAGWPADIRLTVNISPVQLFNPDFEATVLEVLQESGLAPDRLGLEITEGVVIRNAVAVAAVLRRLQRRGIRILLDDFGTGHAGLSYLVRFGFDCIKLDRSFVMAALDDPAAQAIIRATVVLSEDLHLDVVAEGVETEAQLALLCRLGCRRVQGYYYGKPQPPELLRWDGGAAPERVLSLVSAPAGDIDGSTSDV
jgi:diguanylate cyclase (GGDEF)-like protein